VCVPALRGLSGIARGITSASMLLDNQDLLGPFFFPLLLPRLLFFLLYAAAKILLGDGYSSMHFFELVLRPSASS